MAAEVGARHAAEGRGVLCGHCRVGAGRENGRGVGAGSRLSATWLGRLGAGRGRGGESGEASGGTRAGWAGGAEVGPDGSPREEGWAG